MVGDDVKGFQPKRVALDYVVFFGSPFAGENEHEVARNVEFAEKSVHDLSTKAGVSHFAPHLYFPRFLRDEIEEERWLGIGGGAVHLKRCDEAVFRLPPWRTSLSRGMTAEDNLAMVLRKPRITVVTEERWSEYLYHLRQRTLSVGLITL